MGLALVLLDAGFKQSDVLFLLRHTKDRLADPYQRIMASPPAPGMQIFWKDRPNSPHHPYHPTMADCSAFLLIRKIEMLECWPRRKDSRKKGQQEPFILGPTFCFGLDELKKELDRLNYEYPSRMVIELADMAVMLHGLLERAPLAKRGRKASAQ
jgi:hypothetical protein